MDDEMAQGVLLLAKNKYVAAFLTQIHACGLLLSAGTLTIDHFRYINGEVLAIEYVKFLSVRSAPY
jgi:hypothetical protein